MGMSHDAKDPALEMLAMKLQRDVNCLSDPDRNVRRRSLDKLTRSLGVEAPKLTSPALERFFCSHLQSALLQVISSDQVEKCREKAINLLLFFIEKQAVPHTSEQLKQLVQMLSKRLGKLPFAEPTEELRLLLLQSLWKYLKQHAAYQTSLLEIIEPLANVLGKTCLDAFPDVKKISCDCIIVVSTYWREQVALQIGAIVKPLVTNLGHQHSRVRVCTLQALEAVVPCGSEALPELMKGVLLPAMNKVAFDHSALVRKQFVITIASWLARIYPITSFEDTLFPLFLAGFVDESPEIQQVCWSRLQELSAKWQQQEEEASGITANAQEKQNDADADIKELFPVPLTPNPFQHQLPKGARVAAKRLLPKVLPPLLDKTGDWTVQVREQFTRILSVFLVLAGSSINAFLDKIFLALAKNCQDDEPKVFEAVKQCTNVVGHFADAQLVIATLVPMITGQMVGQDTAHHRTNGLVLLGMSIEGMMLDTLANQMNNLTESLCDPGLCQSENAVLQDQLAIVVWNLLTRGAECVKQHDAVLFRLFWVLNHLVACSNESTIAFETSMKSLNALASCYGVNVEQLYRQLMGEMLSKMELPHDEKALWRKNDTSCVLFDSLCRRAGPACADHMALLMPVFLLHLDPNRDADVRLAFLALLETLLGVDAIAPAFQPHCSSLLLKGIVPNIVWRGGRVAATIRKVGIACLYTLLRQGIADKSCLFETAPQMLPVLKSCLDDSDAKTRQLVCLAFQYLFVALPGCLGEEPVHELYAEILKRLDDSNDTVRKASCQTFITFLDAAPMSHFRGTILEYSLDCLFVHLDDAEPDIQEAVFSVIKHMIQVDAAVVIKKAQENRSRHHSPRFCDQLVLLAQQVSDN